MEPTKDNLTAWDARYRRAGEPRLAALVERRLPDVAKRHVLVLGCGSGAGVAALLRAGALVTGVDPSPTVLEEARGQAPDAALFASPLDELPLQLLRGRFDVVVSPALAGLGQVVAALRPGGLLLLHDVHPVLGCLDAALRWRESYFEEGVVQLGEIVSGVVAAGFVVDSLDEAPAEDRRQQDPRVPGEFLICAHKQPSAPT